MNEWFCALNGQPQGPVRRELLMEMLAEPDESGGLHAWISMPQVRIVRELIAIRICI